MNTRPNTPPDLFDRVARDLIEEALDDCHDLPDHQARGDLMTTMIRAAHNDPWMRRRIQTICDYVV